MFHLKWKSIEVTRIVFTSHLYLYFSNFYLVLLTICFQGLFNVQKCYGVHHIQ